MFHLKDEKESHAQAGGGLGREDYAKKAEINDKSYTNKYLKIFPCKW